jgi:hypothetical protein
MAIIGNLKPFFSAQNLLLFAVKKIPNSKGKNTKYEK